MLLGEIAHLHDRDAPGLDRVVGTVEARQDELPDVRPEGNVVLAQVDVVAGEEPRCRTRGPVLVLTVEQPDEKERTREFQQSLDQLLADLDWLF